VSDERDGRAVRVRITAQGKALQDRLGWSGPGLFSERLGELPEEHAARLLAVLPVLEELGQLMRKRP